MKISKERLANFYPENKGPEFNIQKYFKYIDQSLTELSLLKQK